MAKIEAEVEDWARSKLPIYEFMDLKVVSLSNGLYQCFVPLGRSTGNHVNTVHAAFQWAAAEILGGLVVLSNRTDEKYVPVVRSVNIEFKRPALSGITSEAFFSPESALQMNAALEADGRYDFELGSVIKDINDEVVASALGCYAVRKFS